MRAVRAALLGLVLGNDGDLRGALSALVRLLLLPGEERRRVRTVAALDRAIERHFPGAPERPAWLGDLAAASELEDVPLDALARAHAELQGLRLEAGRLEAGGKSRKRGGSFFTPPGVARVLAERTLAPVALGEGVVLDPAAGAGALVLSSALFLLARQERQTVARRLVGLEADPDAVLLARAILRERLGFEPRILHADALATPELAAAFPDALLAPVPRDLGPIDAVIGNPPFVASYARGAVSPGESRRALLERRFPDLGPGEGNGFLHFLALALELARPGGRVGLVVPDTLLVNERYERPRRALLAKTSGLEANVLDWAVFGAASVRTALAIATVAPPTASDSSAAGATVRVFPDEKSLIEDRPASLQRATARELEARPAFAFPRGSTDLALESTLRERGFPLGERCWVRDGINPGPRSFRDVILDASGGYPCLEGKDVSRYALAPARFHVRADPLLLTPELRRAGASFREPWIFDQEKLVSRQTSPTLVFARDDAGHRFLNSAHATGRLPGTEESLHFFLGVLNSGILRWYYARSSGETRRVFPQVHVSALRRLPVPRPDAAEHDAIVALARRLEARPDDGDADRELDDRVAALFRLGPVDAARVAREVRAL